MIHAGAGDVGSFAVQFAHKAGARVIAAASGDGVVLAREPGADIVVDHRAGDFTAAVQGVDLVLDVVGGETQARSYAPWRVAAASSPWCRLPIRRRRSPRRHGSQTLCRPAG